MNGEGEINLLSALLLKNGRKNDACVYSSIMSENVKVCSFKVVTCLFT